VPAIELAIKPKAARFMTFLRFVRNAVGKWMGTSTGMFHGNYLPWDKIMF
jgi:hypothetical protein